MRTTLLTPARLARMLAGVSVLLVILNLLYIFYTYTTGLDSFPRVAAALAHDTQWNIPSIFEALMLIVCAGIAAFIGIEDEIAGLRMRLGWLVLSAAFAFVCLDELFAVHEFVAPIVLAKLHASGLHLGWVGPWGILAAVLALGYLGFVSRLPRMPAMLMVLGGALFASGGVGVATVGGSWAGLDGGALGAKLLVAMDEAMQMAGLAVVAPTVLAILHEVDVTNAERAAASRLTHPRVAIGS